MNIDIINDVKDIKIPKGYHQVESFPEKNTWNGRHVKIIAKADPSGWHQLGRVLLGLLICIPTLGLGALFQKVKNLFHPIGPTKFYGLLIKKVKTNDKPQPEAKPKANMQKAESENADNQKGEDEIKTSEEQTSKFEDKYKESGKHSPENEDPLTGKLSASNEATQKHPVGDFSTASEGNLPFISTLQVSDELNTALPLLPFTYNDVAEQALAKALSGPDSKNKDFSELLDYTVTNTSLRDFIEKKSPICMTLSFDTDRKLKMKKILEDRCEKLVNEVQVLQRIKKVNLDNFNIVDLIPAWKSSRLSIALMLDEEFAQLKISNVKALSPPQIKEIRKRVSAILYKSTILPGISPWKELFVLDIHKLTGQQINEHAFEIPPTAFIFISPSEIKNLDISKLSPEQLDYLFACPNLIEKLDQKQVNLCLNKIGNKQLLSYLTVEQFKKIDFKLTDKETFQALIGPTYALTEMKIQTLSVDQILELKSFFRNFYWENLSDLQFQNIDFAKLFKNDDLKGSFKIFKLLLGPPYCSKAQPRISTMPLEKIYQLKDFFNQEKGYWSLLSMNHISKIDFAKVFNFKNLDEDIQILISMFGDCFTEKAKKIFPTLTFDRLYFLKDLINKGQVKYWSLLSDQQFAGIDMSKIMDFNDLDQAYKIFNSMVGEHYSERAKKLIPTLTVDKLYTLKNLLNNQGLSYWSLISNKQLLEIDFEKVIDTKNPEAGNKIFQSMINTHFIEEKTGFPSLSVERLYFLRDVLKQDKDHWTHLSDSQFSQLDFAKALDLEDLASASEAFKAMLGYAFNDMAKKRIASLSVDKIYLLRELFNSEKSYWGCLSCKQISMLDFSKLLANKKKNEALEMVKAIVSPEYNYETKERVQSLSIPAIITLKGIAKEYQNLMTPNQLAALKNKHSL